jgi:uncharacterized protein
MINIVNSFNEQEALHDLKHYLPAQAPLKDFVHHNTLHAFQNDIFFEALNRASKMFGYKVCLSLFEYRSLYKAGKIKDEVLGRILMKKFGQEYFVEWKEKVVSKKYEADKLPRIGALRKFWKAKYGVDLDALVHPVLFRILCSYLDQGIAIWAFPIKDKGFLDAVREMENKSLASFFNSKRAKTLLQNKDLTISDLLQILISKDNTSLYKTYLFDQQFSHQGWSGMVSTIEDSPQTLLDSRQISLHDFIILELLLEIDAIDSHFKKTNWEPISSYIPNFKTALFEKVPPTEKDFVLNIYQEAFEWTYYYQVLAGIKQTLAQELNNSGKSFQALFCIDDRECSLRRHLEKQDADCSTYGTPGFFGVEFFYQPENGKFYTKLCPAPVTPKYLIKEQDSSTKHKTDINFSKHTHNFYTGWLFTQTLGFWSAIKLFFNIFKPSMSPATASSFQHMDKFSSLTIENKNEEDIENGLKIGFKVEEMALRVGNVLKSIGLIKDFAPIVYVVGHGSSTINNPHYAAYDCGACSGRAGSVNSRVFSWMANHLEVRKLLKIEGIIIPDYTQFVGALHDTTRDEIEFYDENLLNSNNKKRHTSNEQSFNLALDLNSKERSRRFEAINSKLSAKNIHENIKTRSVSLFEPRPELNHATNALCIIGRRNLTKSLFLDRRSFLNSYDYILDSKGDYLLNILKAAAPVCGGINLEYYFSRVDNQKFGAGTKLPHNVMGLVGVANGIDGDLRPGLPSQMIEMHDPIRLLMIVEHFPDVVLTVLKSSPETIQWFTNEWINLVALHPETNEFWRFSKGLFELLEVDNQVFDFVSGEMNFDGQSSENLPIYIFN